MFLPLFIYVGELLLLLRAKYTSEHRNKNVPILISTIITLLDFMIELQIDSGELDKLENVK